MVPPIRRWIEDNPAAAMRGPAINGALGPYRVTRPPDHRDRKNINRIKGSAAAPVLVGEYLCTWIRFIGNRKKKIPRAA